MNFINIFEVFEVIMLSSLIGSLIVLIILVIKGLFKNILSPTFYYYIWIILLIKLIMPFGPQTPLNISNIYEKLSIQRFTSANTQPIKIIWPKQLENKKLDESISKDNLESSYKSVISSNSSMHLKAKVSFQRILCYVWMFVLALLIIKIFIDYKNLGKIVKASINNTNKEHKKILNDCMNKMNIRSKVEILYSYKISSPSLCGFFKPKILIPMKVAASVSDEEFKYTIMHELCHLKSMDIFINFIITILSVIHWFNPILLYGFHKMRQDCEFNCDNHAISYLVEGENIQYGNAIIRILELGTASKRIIGTASMIMNNFELKRRISMISKYKKMNLKGILLGGFIVIILASLGFALNTPKSILNNSISKAAAHEVSTPEAVVSNNSVNYTSSKNPQYTIQPSSNNNSNSITPSSSDIVIYNSHADEAYPSGMTVTDVAALINDKLLKNGLKSSVLKCTPSKEYAKSYESTRSLITNNVKNYSNTILLDIHRDVAETGKVQKRRISFVLCKNNPHYNSNKQFVDGLIKNINDSNKVSWNTTPFSNALGYFNQDLSNKSVLIEIGNSLSSDKDIEDCINALVSTIKNLQKASTN